VFIGMLLFDATRGLFEGWARAAVSFAMAPLAVNVFGAVMLMILAPFLEILVGNAGQSKFDMGPVITVALILAVFAIVMFFGLGAVAAIGRGFGTTKRGDDAPSSRRDRAPEYAMAGGGSGERAEQIAARISMMDRNQGYAAGGAYSSREVFTRRTGDIADAVSAAPMVAGERLGQAYNRAPRPHIRRGEES
jgi:type IV secretion system protein VirB6